MCILCACPCPSSSKCLTNWMQSLSNESANMSTSSVSSAVCCNQRQQWHLFRPLSLSVPLMASAPFTLPVFVCIKTQHTAHTKQKIHQNLINKINLECVTERNAIIHHGLDGMFVVFGSFSRSLSLPMCGVWLCVCVLNNNSHCYQL